jgi:hypothetical protein
MASNLFPQAYLFLRSRPQFQFSKIVFRSTSRLIIGGLGRLRLDLHDVHRWDEGRWVLREEVGIDIHEVLKEGLRVNVDFATYWLVDVQMRRT